MHHSPGALRASALATVLAALLALAAPLTTGLAAAEASRERLRPSAARPEAVADEPSPTTERDGAGPRHAEAEDGSRARTARRAGRDRERSAMLVHVPAAGIVARRFPSSSSPTVGRVVGHSRYYGVPTVAWVERVSANGRWGRVELPYAWPRRDGWIRLEGLASDTTAVAVRVDLSAHRLTVRKRGDVLFHAPVATGRSTSPTPPGEYFVTDRVPFASGSAYGTFAFGISGIQPRLPAGWTGGDQLAIHGTNAPWTIGTNASAGCVRAGESTLARLKPLLRLGTPVVIVP